MSLTTVLNALALPTEAKVDQRIPKKLFVEQGAPTASDKRQIQDGIEELMWVAALKPTNIGVPVFQDSEREYLEIAVLTVDFRPNAKAARLLELIHRAVPYPVLLLASFLNADKTCIGVSTAHKRFNQNEVGKFVVDEVLTTFPIASEALFSASVQGFLGALSLSAQPNRNLFALYQGWVNCILGLSVAGAAGRFVLPSSPEQTRQMREFLQQRSSLLTELSALRAQASKEKQLNRLVELNISIKRLESQLAANQSTLLAF
ncbi:DUF4391 domain-containing protein [Massilia sp. YIM B02763]|uniref:DUF4391 domain-containing protein n=1 Tax=Massilia sp. YIM B02763 TaxID=3050130 RepID=UPI0025B72D5E|nr:DUF4391 domain-containing protein [Massilia sp. YIM B02763]MDN4052266.1 DUF4391 domain-containing protein [Massilia sp. YIM B02763]